MTPRSTPRQVAVDALRGLAVVLMIQQHLGIWLFDLSHNWRAVRAGWGVLNASGGAAAPLFVLLTGVGLALGAQYPGRVLVLRGTLLFAFGVLLNLLTPSWLEPLSFYILHLLGVVVALGPLLRRLSDRALWAAAGLVLAASVVLRGLLKTPLSTSLTMHDASGPLGALRLAFVEGQFPILPWLCFALVGIWAGRRLERPGQLVSASAFCFLLGVLLRLPFWLAAGSSRKGPLALVTRFSFFPASPVFVCVLLGVCLLLLAVFLALERRSISLGWLVPLGRASLTLLVAHVLVFREGATRLSLARTLDAPATLVVILLVLAASILLTSRWERVGYAYGLEWLLRRAGFIALRAKQ